MYDNYKRCNILMMALPKKRGKKDKRAEETFETEMTEL